MSNEELSEYLRLSRGLTPRDATALMRYGANLKRNLKKESIRKAILPGAGATYANRLLSSRLATVAGTEPSAAYNAGKLAVYRVAQSLGISLGAQGEPKITEAKNCALTDALNGSPGVPGGFGEEPKYEQVWVAQPDCCDQCEGLDGTRIGVDEEFEDGEPPVHPNCLCGIEIEETSA